MQYTIQLVPRLTQPTLVTEVLVKQNQPVKKGQPLIRFDRQPYEYQVRQMQALLAKAKQDVHILKANVAVAEDKVATARSQLEYYKYDEKLTSSLASKGLVPWNAHSAPEHRRKLVRRRSRKPRRNWWRRAQSWIPISMG